MLSTEDSNVALYGICAVCIAAGLIDSMARPGRNVTGFTSIVLTSIFIAHSSALGGAGWETIGATQGNRSESLPSRRAVELARSNHRATMDRKPISCVGIEAASSFYGGKQNREIRRGV